MSPLLQVNLTDVSHEGPPQLDPGVYTLEATKVNLTPPVGDKAWQIEVIFKNANAEEGDERTVRKIFSLSEKAKPFLVRFLLACERVELAQAEEFDTDSLIGLRCEAVVISQSWQDKTTGETRSGANISRFVISEEILEQVKSAG